MVNIFSNGFKVDKECVQNVVDEVFSKHNASSPYEVNVNFISKSEMKKLYDKKDHDVLSFPLEADKGPDGVVRYGDILVLGDLPPQKRDELIAHSCLHLLGIHHK